MAGYVREPAYGSAKPGAAARLARAQDVPFERPPRRPAYARAIPVQPFRGTVFGPGDQLADDDRLRSGPARHDQLYLWEGEDARWDRIEAP